MERIKTSRCALLDEALVVVILTLQESNLWCISSQCQHSHCTVSLLFLQFWKLGRDPEGVPTATFQSNMLQHTCAVNVVRFSPTGTPSQSTESVGAHSLTSSCRVTCRCDADDAVDLVMDRCSRFACMQQEATLSEIANVCQSCRCVAGNVLASAGDGTQQPETST